MALEHYAYDDRGQRGLRTLVRVRSDSRKARDWFIGLCLRLGLTRNGEWSGRAYTWWEVIGDAEATSLVRLEVPEWDRPSPTYVHPTGAGGGADTRAVKAKSRAREALREGKPRRDWVDLLARVYGADSVRMRHALRREAIPPDYNALALTEAQRRAFLVEWHLEYVRTLRDRADCVTASKWARAELLLTDWRAPREMANAKRERCGIVYDVRQSETYKDGPDVTVAEVLTVPRRRPEQPSADVPRDRAEEFNPNPARVAQAPEYVTDDFGRAWERSAYEATLPGIDGAYI